MARNQPFDFSDEDDIVTASTAGSRDVEFSESGSTDLAGMAVMGDDLMGETATGKTGRKTGTAAAAAQVAQQQTATQTRAATGQQDTPTSMQHKGGNQPR
jgi:hypothetical protein